MKPIEHGVDARCCCRPCPKDRDAMFWRQDEEARCEQFVAAFNPKPKGQNQMDPLIKDVKRNYAKSHRKKVDDCLATISRWQRKRTIADNKLSAAWKELMELTKDHAELLDKHSLPPVHENPPAKAE